MTRNQYYCPGVNIERLWSLIPQKVQDEAEKRTDGKVPVLDVVKKVCIYVYVHVNTYFMEGAEYTITLTMVVCILNASYRNILLSDR